MWHVGSQFPYQGSNPCLLQWKCGVLTTGSPGNSPGLFSLQTAQLLMGRATSPPSQLLGLRGSHHWCLQAVGWGQVMALMSQREGRAPQPQLLCGRTISQIWLPPNMAAPGVHVSRVREPAPASPGDSPRPAGRSDSGSYQITAFALGPSA